MVSDAWTANSIPQKMLVKELHRNLELLREADPQINAMLVSEFPDIRPFSPEWDFLKRQITSEPAYLVLFSTGDNAPEPKPLTELDRA